jgi:hypothetical protein
VAERKAFLLRLDPAVYDAMQRWAADDLRSLNAQIDFVVRRALQQQGRLKGAQVTPAEPPESPGSETPGEGGSR